MQNLTQAFLAAILAGACGCAELRAELRTFEDVLVESGVVSFDRASDRPLAVEIAQDGQCGRGAVVGPNRIVTVAHVVEGMGSLWISVSRETGLIEGRIVQRVAANPEGYVFVEIETQGGAYGTLFGFAGFAAENCFTLGSGPPAGVLTKRGFLPWEIGTLRPGDSGSPVLDASGKLVGLVSGRTELGEPVMVSLRAEAFELRSELLEEGELPKAGELPDLVHAGSREARPYPSTLRAIERASDSLDQPTPGRAQSSFRRVQATSCAASSSRGPQPPLPDPETGATPPPSMQTDRPPLWPSTLVPRPLPVYSSRDLAREAADH